MRPVIEGQTRANAEAVKWYLSLNMNFFMSTSPGVKTDLAVTFHSEEFKSIDTHELDYQIHVRYNQIVLQIDEFQRDIRDFNAPQNPWFHHYINLPSET